MKICPDDPVIKPDGPFLGYDTMWKWIVADIKEESAG
jgi:hypothetical protein